MHSNCWAADRSRAMRSIRCEERVTLQALDQVHQQFKQLDSKQQIMSYNSKFGNQTQEAKYKFNLRTLGIKNKREVIRQTE